jgi:hypothetical protein
MMQAPDEDQPRYDYSRHDDLCPHVGEATRQARARARLPTWYVCIRPTGRVLVLEARDAERALEAAYTFAFLQHVPAEADWLQHDDCHELRISERLRLYARRKDRVPTKASASQGGGDDE